MRSRGRKEKKGCLRFHLFGSMSVNTLQQDSLPVGLGFGERVTEERGLYELQELLLAS